MFRIFQSLLCVLLLCIGAISSEECYPTHLPCDNGECIFKHYWCDDDDDCTDHSDENYCSSDYDDHESLQCGSKHFQCYDSDRCIPESGRCDGYVSCPDKSDENNCGCSELNDETGTIVHKSYIVSKGTIIYKCWKVTVNEHQYLELDANILISSDACRYGNVTIGSANVTSPSNTIVICSNPLGNLTHQNFKSRFYEDVKIWYTNWYSSKDGWDVVSIKYEKIDKMCLSENKFQCDKYSCISPDKECDENIDCDNGLDEKNCDYGALSASYSESYRRKAREWMLKQKLEDNTHKAVVAIHLAHDINTNFSIREQDIIVKQLELDLATYLLRNKTDRITVTELSAYINALLVICHDPKNFNGFDLIAILKDELQKLQGYAPPLPYLTLCNAKEQISEDDVDSLFEILESTTDRGYILEIQALAILSLTCIINNDHQYLDKKENITAAMINLKKEQLTEGSFGNDYTTALVLQAMIANSKPNEKDEVLKSAMEYMRKRQRDDGSYGDFLTTYLTLPVLNFKSLMDVGKANCTESLNRSRKSVISDINTRLGNKIPVKYSLIIGDEKDQILPISLRAPQNITILQFMTLAADIDPKYKFKTHQIRKKAYIYEIFDIPNDPENNQFWFMYEKIGDDTTIIPIQSPEEVTIGDKHHIIMWYKTLDHI